MAAAGGTSGEAVYLGLPVSQLPNQAIADIVDRLWHGATFEDEATRCTCVEGIAQLALRAKEPVSGREC